MVIFPLAPDQTIAQMWSNGARGRGGSKLLVFAISRSVPSSTAWCKINTIVTTLKLIRGFNHRNFVSKRTLPASLK